MLITKCAVVRAYITDSALQAIAEASLSMMWVAWCCVALNSVMSILSAQASAELRVLTTGLKAVLLCMTQAAQSHSSYPAPSWVSCIQCSESPFWVCRV